MSLTIFTPTYNREVYLSRLYYSLLNQTNKSFSWIIVDDGSTDNTEELVNKFISEDKIDIIYFKQQNSGKHVAHNKGVELCKTELFFCVDSDDYLTEDSVESVLSTWNKRKISDRNIGIVALRGYVDGSIMENAMPLNIYESTLSDLYNIYGKKGETALIFKTKYLKENLFPCFKGEKFLSEEVVYNKLDKIGKLIILNKIIYIMEYLEGGLTKNYIKMWKSSPQGVITLLRSRYEIATEIVGIKKYYRTIKAILVLNSFCIHMKISILENTPNKYLSILLLLPSYFCEKIKFNDN